MGALFCAAWLVDARAASFTKSKAAAAARAEQAFQQARQKLNRDTNDLAAACQFARACFDMAEFARHDEERADYAERGIAVCHRVLERDPRQVAAHYYLAMNLGQLARTRTLTALKLVDEMETVFKKAIALDPTFDYAGPHRSLGLLYLDAPAWPASVGDRVKAREHLEKAVELAPRYPDNRLSLLEAYLKWGQPKISASDLKAAEEALESARKELTGEAWAASWEDWDRRWRKIKAKAKAPPKLEAPKHKE